MEHLRFFYSETNPEVMFKKARSSDGKQKKWPRICVCSAYEPTTMTLKFGLSSCNYKDKYDKVAGREIAMHRAVDEPMLEVSCTDPKMLKYISSAIAQELMMYKLDKTFSVI